MEVFEIYNIIKKYICDLSEYRGEISHIEIGKKQEKEFEGAATLMVPQIEIGEEFNLVTFCGFKLKRTDKDDCFNIVGKGEDLKREANNYIEIGWEKED